jgi:hypothetical protein
MTANKKKWRVGDSGWEVEWTYELAFEDDEQTSVDRDNCKERRRWFETKEEATKYAREVAYPQTVGVFGFVEIRPFVIEYLVPEDRAGIHVEYMDGEDFYEGEG